MFCRGNKAVGVEYLGDKIGRAKGEQKPSVARASRLVIVSAGAFGSPSILERSGIGASEILKKNGIKEIVNLPGVGEHYMGRTIVASMTLDPEARSRSQPNLYGFCCGGRCGYLG